MSKKSPTPPETILILTDGPDAEIAELLLVPRLGPTRARALAGAGLKTLADLHAASPEAIGGIKGVGQRNAELIKAWLAAQGMFVAELPDDSAPANGAEAAAGVPETATRNQEIQDKLPLLEDAITRLKGDGAAHLKKKDRKEGDGLVRQLDKLSAVASDLPESMDTLTGKQIKAATRALDDASSLLEVAASYGKLRGKEREALSEKLRVRRKALQKALGA